VAIIPAIRCRRLSQAVDFYTKVLDFECVEGDDPSADAGFCVLSTESDTIF
jgi:catechol 2,3-dioxygenase-like lactoylglutathione lyase family enzyme